jgi:hypothetical protein
MNTLQKYLQKIANRQYKTDYKALKGRIKHRLKRGEIQFPGTVDEYIATRHLDRNLKDQIFKFYTLCQ